jgi:hypothetical protein
MKCRQDFYNAFAVIAIVLSATTSGEMQDEQESREKETAKNKETAKKKETVFDLDYKRGVIIGCMCCIRSGAECKPD